jgi:hypothetical protein
VNFGNSRARELFHQLATEDQVKLHDMIQVIARMGYWHEVISATKFDHELEIIIRIHGELDSEVRSASSDSSDGLVSD